MPNKNGISYGIRTRVDALRRRSPRPLDEGDIHNDKYHILIINVNFKKNYQLMWVFY